MTSSNKERNVNFNQDETTKLAWLLKDYPVITSKKTDHASNLQKDAAWRSLAEKFNSDTIRYRSIKQLQQKINNMKKTARKEMSAERSGRRQTGGGPPPPKPSETTEWLNSIIGESISGVTAVYDSDAISSIAMESQNTTATANLTIDLLENDNLYIKCNSPSLDRNMTTKLETQSTDASNNTQLETQYTDVAQNVGTETDTKECVIVFDTSTPKALLRKPISKQLLSSSNKRKKAFTPLETRKRLISHFDIKDSFLTHKKAREEEIKKYAQEEHTQNMQQKMEIHNKKLELMQEKHLLYMEQQKEIHNLEIEFKKQLNNLTLEKIRLEIEKLKK